MKLFGLGKDGRLALAEQAVAKLQADMAVLGSLVRTLEAEQVNLHAQVRKWMRRAVASERNQERAVSPDGSVVTPAPAPRALWGARGRMGRPAPAAPEPLVFREEESENGVHP